jgi:hypothetical protein
MLMAIMEILIDNVENDLMKLLIVVKQLNLYVRFNIV